MKDISIYFQPVEPFGEFSEDKLGEYTLKHTENYFPEMKADGVAIFNVPEYRNDTDNKNYTFNTNFRKSFYELYKGFNWDFTLYDLGTIQPGDQISDTYHAITTVCTEFIKKNIIPVVVGGSQDITVAIYKAYKELEQLINLTTIDNNLDLGVLIEKVPEPIHNAWLNNILVHHDSYLFNYTNIGAQGHFISNKTFNIFDELYFDICRLGDVNADITLTEPYMRNSDIVSIDLTCIRASDLQNNHYTSPNGLFAHELCRIMRYAGISDKLSSIGIFNYYSQNHKVTDELVGQLIWYFLEGYAQRKGDFPIGSKKTYTKFRVFMEELNEEIIFYKSDKSGRWWIEVPYPSNREKKYLRHQMIPCSYETYKEAMKGEIPDLWWKTYQKLA